MRKISLLGAGLIGGFYATALSGQRSRDQIEVVCAATEASARSFADRHAIPRWTTDMAEAVNDPETELVIVGIPNYLHKEAVLLAVQAGKAVFCTKPLGRNAREAREMLEAVEKAGVFHGYLEDLVYTPKTLKVAPVGPERRAGQDPVGALARGPPRPAQRLVLEQGAFRRRGHC